MSGSIHQAIAIGEALDEFVPGNSWIPTSRQILWARYLSVSHKVKRTLAHATFDVPIFQLFTRSFFEFDRIEFRVDLIIGKSRSASELVK